MSKADEMFEKLGYKKRIHVNNQKEEIDFIGYDKEEDEVAIEDCSLLFLIWWYCIRHNNNDDWRKNKRR